MPLLKSRPFIISAILYTVVSLVCTQIPLVNYLGYEFSVIIAVLVTIVSPLLTVNIVSSAMLVRRASDDPFALLKLSLRLSSLLLVIPLAVMLTNAMFVKNCSLLEGVAFYLLLPVVTVWLSGCLAFFCVAHYRNPRLMFFVFVLVTLFYAAGQGYFTPAVHSYNFFYGFFPGVTYDEILAIDWRLVVFRIITIGAGGVLAWMAVVMIRNVPLLSPTHHKGLRLIELLFQEERRRFTLGIVLVCAVLYMFRGTLGFETTSRYIQTALGAKYESEHFSIYYSPHSYDSTAIRWVAAEHEFRLKQVTDALAVPFHHRIKSFVYPSAETKHRLIGTGSTNIAKPWNGQIHITQQTLDATLKHELVHVVAAPFGVPVIRASLSTGLVEGLAMAIEWDWGHRTLHQYAAAMRRFGVAPQIAGLMNITGFAAQSSSVSYVLAGSLCRFLIDRYGMRRLMRVYRSGNYEDVYGRGLNELITEWQNMLDRIEVPESDRDAIDVLFRRPPIFRKVCARVVAGWDRDARQKLSDRDYAGALARYSQSYAAARSYESLSGYLLSSLRLGHTSDVTAAPDSIFLRESNPGQYLLLYLTVGDAFWAEGETGKADDLYKRVQVADVAENYTEAATVRRLALVQPSLADGFRRYILSDANDSVKVLMLDSLSSGSADRWLPLYLQGRVLIRLKEYSRALSVLQRIDLSIQDHYLEAVRLKSVGRTLFYLERFQEAKAAFWSSLNHVSTQVALNEVTDWIERCEFMDNSPILR
jgi:hypothetical protein